MASSFVSTVSSFGAASAASCAASAAPRTTRAASAAPRTTRAASAAQRPVWTPQAKTKPAIPTTTQMIPAAREFFRLLSNMRAGGYFPGETVGYNIGNDDVTVKHLLGDFPSMGDTIDARFTAMGIPQPFLAAQMFWLERGHHLVCNFDQSQGTALKIQLLTERPVVTRQFFVGRTKHHYNTTPANIDPEIIAFYTGRRVAPVQAVAVPTSADFPVLVEPVLVAATAAIPLAYSKMAAVVPVPRAAHRAAPHAVPAAPRSKVGSKPGPQLREHTAEQMRMLHEATVKHFVERAFEASAGMPQADHARVMVQPVIRVGDLSDHILNQIYGPCRPGASFDQREDVWTPLGLENPFAVAQRHVYKETGYILLNFSQDADSNRDVRMYFVLHLRPSKKNEAKWHGQNVPPTGMIGGHKERNVCRTSFGDVKTKYVPFACKQEDFPAASASASATDSTWWGEKDVPSSSFSSVAARPPAFHHEEVDDEEVEDDDWETRTEFVIKPNAPKVKPEVVEDVDEDVLYTDEECESPTEFVIKPKAAKTLPLPQPQLVTTAESQEMTFSQLTPEQQLILLSQLDSLVL